MSQITEPNQKHDKSVKRKIVVVFGLFTVLSFYTFNCAPPAFQLSDSSVLHLSSNGTLISDSDLAFSEAPMVAPQSLLTFMQIYESMLNLTDQKGTVSNAQIQEFERRAGAFSVTPGIDKINSPMLFALTSFGGEVCNGLVAREQALQATERKYFQSVNFGGAINLLSDSQYQDAVSKMAQSFMGRSPSSDEVTLFSAYKSEFVAAIPAANLNQAAQTRSLMLSTCAALLSSFDIYTY